MLIDFTATGNSDQFVVSGFSSAERLGRWSTGQNSSVRLNVPPMMQRLELRLVLMPMTVIDKVPEQSITILADGVQIHQGMYAGWSDIRLPLPPSLTGVVTLQFLHPTPVIPSSLGTSSDGRALALLFKQIRVVESADVMTQEPATPHPNVLHVPLTSTVSPDVWVGRDGWLFLIGGSNAVLRYYTDKDYFPPAKAEEWAGLLMSRRARLAQHGVQYLHLAAPDKISVYPDLLGGDLPNRHRHPIALVQAALDTRGATDTLVNPLSAFAAHPNRDRLFLKTDTHWSYAAGMTVLELVAERLGVPRKLSLEGREQRRYRITFDLGSKIEPAVSEEATAVVTRTGVSRVYSNELAVKFEENAKARKPVVHNGVNVIFRNENADAIDKCIVIFGDSFMDFQESTTTVIFAEQFRETHFIWSPRIDYGYVARIHADIVMTETAERFMVQLPADDYNLDRDVFRRLANYPA